jgi:hypothetical protein
VTLVTRAVVVVIVYHGVVISPLVFAVIGAGQPEPSGRTSLGARIHRSGDDGPGFALVARVRAVALPFGQDALLQFHRQIGCVGLVFILIHFAISAHWREVTPGKALASPLLVWFGMAAMLSLIVLVATVGVAARAAALLRGVARNPCGAGAGARGRRGWAHHPRRRVRQLAVEADPLGWGSLTRCADPFGNGFCLITT